MFAIMSKVWYFLSKEIVYLICQVKVLFSTPIAKVCDLSSAWAGKLICVGPGGCSPFSSYCEHNGYQENTLTRTQEMIWLQIFIS